ncbi:MAG: glycosyltransferase [Candidatus Altiarchaeales archaeon]|nr:glycosyltransferase [Candidatus Altiarchaeales archaeon]
MRKHLDDYRQYAGDQVVDEIYDSASTLDGKHVVHVNSTYSGGGVAELLDTLVMLMNDVGLDTGWRILHGTPDFFEITKKFHNTLQGAEINLTNQKKRIYEGINERFSNYTHLYHDCVIVHDPQPLSMIQFYEKKQPWIWRLHIDISNLNQDGEKLFNYFKSFIVRYDAMIVSMDSYKKDIPVDQRVMRPSIDPLSPKNEVLSDQVIDRYLSKFGVDQDKPIICQVSRFDYFKDPEGVVKIFKKVREEIDCRLVLVGSMATDDPESEAIYKHMVKEYGDDPDIEIISALNHILVNALQRRSSVVLQKSLREGFALTVSEALWKGTPVVGSNVGGIPAQIIEGETGFLLDPLDYDGFADRVKMILGDDALSERLGEAGKEHVRNNFLVTRHLKDYFHLFREVIR